MRDLNYLKHEYTIQAIYVVTRERSFAILNKDCCLFFSANGLGISIGSVSLKQFVKKTINLSVKLC